MKTVESESASANEDTFGKYQTAAKQIRSGSRRVPNVRVSQIGPDLLDSGKTSWSPRAAHKDDRIGKTTAGRPLEEVKSFLAYCVKMRWVATNPATDFKAIKPDESVTLPLLSGRYEQVIAATYEYDKNARRASDMFGDNLRAIIELIRWTGLRIGDALLCARSRIAGNKFRLRTRKSGAPLTVVLPDHVVAALNALPKRPDLDPDFFLSGKYLRDHMHLHDCASKILRPVTSRRRAACYTERR